MSKDNVSNFSGENRPQSRSAAIPEAPPASSLYSSSHSISGGTKKNSKNQDNSLTSKSGKNSTKKQSKYHMESTKNTANPSSSERKSPQNEEKNSPENELTEEKKEIAHAKINPRILHLDFIEKDVPGNIQQVRAVIINHTQIRSFTIKVLPKGGLSILFPNKVAKLFAEDIIYKKLEGKLKRKGFLLNKKLFEVSCRVPQDIDPKNVMKEIAAEKFIKRGGSETIFFMSSQLEASVIVRNGKFIHPYHLEFAPFTFAPRIACKNCGSHEHFECTKEFCKSCGEEHKSDSCISDIKKCYYCKGNHSFSDCSVFKKKASEAKSSKKKSYAEALMNPGSTTLSKRQPVVTQTKGVTNSQTTEIISTYCKVAGVPFHETILDQIIEAVMQKNQQSLSPGEEELLIPKDEPKKKSSKTINKEYATAVIESYERSTNPKASSVSSSSAEEMKGVEGNVQAFCKCGILFKPNPGFKNHFYSTKCIFPAVTCPCKKFMLNLDNWSTTYGPFCKHLKRECLGSSS